MKALDVGASITELAQGFSEDQWSIWASLNGLDLEPSQCRAEAMNARKQFPEEMLVSLIEASLMSVEEGTKEALQRMKQAEPLRGKMASRVEELFGEALNDLVIRLQYDYPVDAAFWQRLASLWEPWLEAALFEGLEEAAITVNFDLINEPARAWARERAFDLVNIEGDQSVIRSISGQLETIKEQLSTGELPWLELRNRLSEIFSESRAWRIAETEITNAFTTSGRLAAKEEDMTEKRSISVHDHLVCFPAWTLVQTDRGPLPIQWIKSGDLVLTRGGFFPVVLVSKRWYGGRMVGIKAGSHSLVATENHPVWTSEKGWLKCGDLNEGQTLETFLKKPIKVDSLVDFQVGDSADSPAMGLKIVGLSRILGRILMPVNAINLKRNSEIWKKEVNGVSPDLSFLEKLQAHCAQCFSDSFLRKGLALKRSIARKATELAVFIGGDLSKGFATVSALDQNGGPSALFRAVVSRISLVPLKWFAASLTNQPRSLGVFPLAFEGAEGISFGHRLVDRKLLAASRTGLSDGGCLLVGDSAFHRAIFPVCSGGRHPKFFSAISTGQRYLSGLGSRVALSRTVSEPYVFARTLWSRELFSAAFASILKRHYASLSLTYLVSLYHRRRRKPTWVYNLEVDGPSEFYANGILVHNCEICREDEATGWIPIDDPYPFSWGGATVYGPAFHVHCRCGEAYR